VRTRPARRSLLSLLLLCLAASACSDETGDGGFGGGAAVDEPCESNEDCQEGLECDDHDGEATCQEPHDD
jgi:hypothetical protein